MIRIRSKERANVSTKGAKEVAKLASGEKCVPKLDIGFRQQRQRPSRTRASFGIGPASTHFSVEWLTTGWESKITKSIYGTGVNCGSGDDRLIWGYFDHPDDGHVMNMRCVWI